MNTSVPFPSPEAFRADNTGAALSKFDRARVDMALNGIQTLTAILMQREVDSDCEGAGLLVLDSCVACGILDAIGSCARLVEATIDQAGRV
mgnify:FL=1